MNRQTVAFILTFAFLLSLFGCSKKIKPADTVQGGFESDFVLNLYETEYKGNAKIKDKTLAEFSFSSPEDISGLNLKLENEKYTARFGDITYEGNINELPSSTPMLGIYEALFSAHDKDDLKSDSGGYFSEVNISGNGYKIYFRADGFPKKIIFADTEANIEFSNISYLF